MNTWFGCDDLHVLAVSQAALEREVKAQHPAPLGVDSSFGPKPAHVSTAMYGCHASDFACALACRSPHLRLHACFATVHFLRTLGWLRCWGRRRTESADQDSLTNEPNQAVATQRKKEKTNAMHPSL